MCDTLYLLRIKETIGFKKFRNILNFLDHFGSFLTILDRIRILDLFGLFFIITNVNVDKNCQKSLI